MKWVVVFLDDDGYEAYRMEYRQKDKIPEEYKPIFESMDKGEVRQIGEAILEVFP